MIKVYRPLVLVLLWSIPSLSQNDAVTQPPRATQSTPSSALGTPAISEPRCEKLEIVQEAKAPYPPEAKQQNIQGEVLLQVHVSTTGDVVGADVVHGNPILAESAVWAAKQWRYKSHGEGPIPAACQTNLEFFFSGSDFGVVPMRIRVSEAVTGGLLIHKVAPRRVGIKGTVVLVALINEQGNVERLRAFSGPPELVPAAMDAVQHWSYKPYILNGMPVQVDTNITVKFKR